MLDGVAFAERTRARRSTPPFGERGAGGASGRGLGSAAMTSRNLTPTGSPPASSRPRTDCAFEPDLAGRDLRRHRRDRRRHVTAPATGRRRAQRRRPRGSTHPIRRDGPTAASETGAAERSTRTPSARHLRFAEAASPRASTCSRSRSAACSTTSLRRLLPVDVHRRRTGPTHTIATTQFEATDARRAFPLLRRACVQGHLHRDAGRAPRRARRVLELAGRRRDARSTTGRREVDFATTMKMSTYLVAVRGRDRSSRRAPSTWTSGVPLAVVFPPGKELHLTDVRAGRRRLRAAVLRGVTSGSRTPATRSTLVAIPDFIRGRDGEPGLRNVPSRPKRCSSTPRPRRRRSRSVRIAMVIVPRSLAHMWFGDLVTMAVVRGSGSTRHSRRSCSTVLGVDAYRPAVADVGALQRGARRSASRSDGLRTRRARSSSRCTRRPRPMAMADPITYSKGLARCSARCSSSTSERRCSATASAAT